MLCGGILARIRCMFCFRLVLELGSLFLLTNDEIAMSCIGTLGYIFRVSVHMLLIPQLVYLVLFVVDIGYLYRIPAVYTRHSLQEP